MKNRKPSDGSLQEPYWKDLSIVKLSQLPDGKLQVRGPSTRLSRLTRLTVFTESSELLKGVAPLLLNYDSDPVAICRLGFNTFVDNEEM